MVASTCTHTHALHTHTHTHSLSLPHLFSLSHLRWSRIYPVPISLSALIYNACVLSCFSRVWLCDPMDCSPPGCLCPWDSPGTKTGVSCHFLLQDLLDRGNVSKSLMSPALAGGFFTTSTTWEAHTHNIISELLYLYPSGVWDLFAVLFSFFFRQRTYYVHKLLKLIFPLFYIIPLRYSWNIYFSCLLVYGCPQCWFAFWTCKTFTWFLKLKPYREAPGPSTSFSPSPGSEPGSVVVYIWNVIHLKISNPKAIFLEIISSSKS